MSSSIAAHLRHNVVAYLALFFAFTGSAYALGRGEVKSKHIAANAVKSKHVMDGQIKAADLATGAVTTAKIANGAVNAQKVAPNALTGDEIDELTLDAGILQSRIGNGCPVGQAIRTVAQNGGITCQSSGGAPSGAAGGDLTGIYPNPTIANNAVNSAKIAANAVNSAKIADNAVNSAAIAAGAITPAKIAVLPSVSARSQMSFLQSAGVGGGLGFELEDHDTASMHSTSTNSDRLVAPIAGVYAITGSVRWAGAATSEFSRSLQLRRNGDSGQILADSTSPGQSSTASLTQHVSVQRVLGAGEFVDLQVSLQASSGFASAGHGQFAMTWIAPAPAP